MSIKQKTKILSCMLCSALVTTPLINFISSCQAKKPDVQKIELFPEATIIKPGETSLIRAIVKPTDERTQNLDWSVDSLDPQITISDTGLLSAPITLALESAIDVVVTATYPKNREIFATTTITILQQPTYNFQGFKDNTIYYVDRQHNEATMPIYQKPGTMEYYLPHPIDIFEMDMEPRPIGYSSWFKFTPLIDGHSLPYMKFTLSNGHAQEHAIQWDNYRDGSWTFDIPDFITINSTAIFDSIDVTFACDPRVKLTIPLNAWQSTTQDSSTEIIYYPTSESDQHNIELQEQNIYRVYLFCPAYEKVGKYTGVLDTIYCFRPKYQYTEYEFEPRINPQLDPDMANIFSTSPTLGETFKLPINQRKLDNFRYYSFRMEYTFAINQRFKTAEDFHFDNLFLGSLYIYDPKYDREEYLAGRLDMYVEWI